MSTPQYTLGHFVAMRRVMKFKAATDELMIAITAADIAKEIGCSSQAVKQARSKETAIGYRNPPPGWQDATAKLAERNANRLTRLAAKLRATE
jgi:hypothetical protein